MPSLFHHLRRAPSKFRKVFFAERAERLHIGSGEVRIPGWTNIDNRRLAGVDRGVAHHEPGLETSRDGYLRDTGVR